MGTCTNFTGALCKGAPCWEDPHAEGSGPLNLTCLCPMFTSEWGLNSEVTFALSAADVGHFSCADISSDGVCAMNTKPKIRVESGKGMPWAVAAVAEFATASRTHDEKRCASWAPTIGF